MKQLFTFLSFVLPLCLAAQCSLEEYQNLLKEAKDAQKSGKYDLAINKLTSAQTCQPEKAEEVKKRILNVFNEVNLQRILAIQNEQEARKQQEVAQKNAEEAKSQRDSAQIERNNAIQNAEEAMRQRDSATIARNDALAQKKIAEERAREYYANDLAYKSQIALRDGNRTAAYRIAEFAQQYVHESNANVNRSLNDALYFNDTPDSINHLPWHHNLEGHTGRITDVAFSPDGPRLATSSLDDAVKIWDMATGKIILTLLGPEDSFWPDSAGFRPGSSGVLSVAFSPDGSRLAAGFSDYSGIIIWDLSTTKVVLKLEHGSDVASLAFSPDGKWLLSISSDSNHYPNVIIWNLSTGKEKITLGKSDKNWINCAAFSPDSKSLVTGHFLENTIKIWNLSTGNAEFTLKGHAYSVNSLAFSPNGQLLASGSEDQTAKIWDLTTRKVLLTLNAGGGLDRKGVKRVLFSPDGQLLATGSFDQTAKIWDISTGKITFNLEAGSGFEKDFATAIAFSPDGQRLATGSDDQTAKIWNLAPTSTPTLNGHESPIRSLAFSSDGQRLATGSDDYSIKIWDLTTGKVMWTLNGHDDGVWGVVFSPNGKLLASASSENDRTVKIWDLTTGKSILTIKTDASLTSIAFSPNSKQIATGAFDNTAKIWDLSNGKNTQEFKGHEGCVASISFSPDGKQLATGSWDKTAKIWDLSTGNNTRTLEEHTNRVHCVAFSPDGLQLATASYDSTAKVWDLASGKVIKTLKDHVNYVLTLAFSPNGQRLATGSHDHTAKIWNLATGQAELTLPCNADFVWSVAFSPDGRQLATTAWDNTAKIWQIAKPENHLAILTAAQLQYYKMDNLLDQLPNNESKLIATHDIWQIAAFADLYAEKITKSLPKPADHDRALRLYQACLSHNVDNPYFEKKIANLEKVWKEKTE